MVLVVAECRRWRVSLSRGVMHIVVRALPASFDGIAQTVSVLVREPGLDGIRVLIDCTELPPEQEPPPLAYLERLADVLYPLNLAAQNVRCALVVRGQSFTWRARFLIAKVSSATIEWRAFGDSSRALAWLGVPDESNVHGGDGT